MKTNIAKEDVLALREELLQYAEKAEMHEFPKIMLIHLNLDKTILKFEEYPIKELNAMFRCVYMVIGKDYSDYKE